MIAHKMPEYVKLAEIALVQVIGSVEDARCFSKSKLRNCLTTHLDLVVQMFAHQFYTLENFPNPQAVAAWKEMQIRYGFDA
ncbi:unnamed protein product [Sphagnum troendelagicum]|uniref:Uncharacterized protein n=1 Tax=Sphagnum troendelagicum TaxID=128251 RepID=A0ABP0U9G4_9BRYO